MILFYEDYENQSSISKKNKCVCKIEYLFKYRRIELLYVWYLQKYSILIIEFGSYPLELKLEVITIQQTVMVENKAVLVWDKKFRSF